MSLTIPVSEIVNASDNPLLAKHGTWKRVQLGKIASILNGFAFESCLFSKSNGIPLIRIRDVGRSETACFFTGDYEQQFLVTSGDLLVGMDGEFRAATWVGPDALLNQRVCKIAPDSRFYDRKFIEFVLPGYLDAIRELTSSVTVTHLSSRDIAETPLPLPPLAEQKRIVAKVEHLLARVNAARGRLAKVPAMLKRFRQSVLASACSGQLTADWRAENENVGNADELLKKISQHRNEPHNEPDIDRPDELPNSWAWTNFGYLIGELRNGISTRPTLEPPGNPILRISAVRPGKVLMEDLRYLPESKDLIETYGLKNGDLLFTRYNGSIDLLGVCGMVRDLGNKTLLYPDKLMRVRFDHCFVIPAFAEVFFQGPETRKRLMAEAKSSAGQQGISGKNIKEQAFALPPLAEQQEIVRRVEKLFALADKIEAKVQSATARVEKITQSILAKAFRGELVPTEAELARQEGRDYEPACVLLERIKAASASATEKPAKRTRRKQVEPVAVAEPQPFTLEPVAETEPTEPKRKLPKGIFFTRGAVASYIVEKMHKLPNFGRVELEKCLYLTETLVGIDLAGRYGRRAAGPLDHAIYKLESVAKKQGWFTSRQSQYNMTRYAPGEKITDRLRPAKTILGDKQKVMDQLLAAIAKMDTERAELFATVYAAWNDFLLDGKAPSDDQLVTEVREHWHEAKQRFTPERIQKCIKWIRDQGFAPRGIGPHTYLIPKDEPGKSKTRKKVPTQRRLEWDAA